ncbi:MAG: hypothetical protein FWD49_01530 [Firmicutes bacterium]|nr:hypothetical protein [Bacillota bacterium]
MLFKEIATLFTGMTPAVVICLAVGLVFIFIEIFEPGFGVFGIVGGLLSVTGIILRVLVKDGNAVSQIMLILFFQIILIGIAVILMAVATKKGWFNRTALIVADTAVPENFKDTDIHIKLIGKSGISITPLRPAGKAEIESETYDVVTEGFFIAQGESVNVIRVEGNQIIVSGNSNIKS